MEGKHITSSGGERVKTGEVKRGDRETEDKRQDRKYTLCHILRNINGICHLSANHFLPTFEKKTYMN